LTYKTLVLYLEVINTYLKNKHAVYRFAPESSFKSSKLSFEEQTIFALQKWMVEFF